MRDEHQRIKEVDRGVQARVILESPLWDEAYQAVINSDMEKMLSSGTSDEETLECKRRISALQAIKQRLATVMATGEMAEMQLKEARK